MEERQREPAAQNRLGRTRRAEGGAVAAGRLRAEAHRARGRARTSGPRHPRFQQRRTALLAGDTARRGATAIAAERRNTRPLKMLPTARACGCGAAPWTIARARSRRGTSGAKLEIDTIEWRGGRSGPAMPARLRPLA